MLRCFRAIAGIFSLALILVACSPNVSDNESEARSVETAQTAENTATKETATNPDSRLTVVSPEAFYDRIDEAEGKVVVINLWATWCPPCIEEMPHFVKFYEDYRDKVTFLSVSADHPETVEDAVVPFMDEHALPFHVYVLDSVQPDTLSERFGKHVSGALPETLVLNRDGSIYHSWTGAIDYETLTGKVDPLL